LVAHLLATEDLWVRIHDISQKYKMGYISKGVATHSCPSQKIYKKRLEDKRTRKRTVNSEDKRKT
jgi:hypothetical protein